MPTLTIDPTLILKPLQPDDAAALFALIDRNRAHLTEFLTWVATTTQLQHSRDFIARTLQEASAGTHVHLGVFFRGQLVGHMSLMDIAPAHKAEIGYWLSEDAVGQGIMTRAVQAVINYAFTDLKLIRLLIRCRPTNVRSIAVTNRLGFKFEGTERLAERQGDKFFDLDHYALLSTDQEA